MHIFSPSGYEIYMIWETQHLNYIATRFDYLSRSSNFLPWLLLIFCVLSHSSSRDTLSFFEIFSISDLIAYEPMSSELR